jgi:hypothetical protein
LYKEEDPTLPPSALSGGEQETKRTKAGCCVNGDNNDTTQHYCGEILEDNFDIDYATNVSVITLASENVNLRL